MSGVAQDSRLDAALLTTLGSSAGVLARKEGE